VTPIACGTTMVLSVIFEQKSEPSDFSESSEDTFSDFSDKVQLFDFDKVYLSNS
jgi:hypothetical protein